MEKLYREILVYNATYRQIYQSVFRTSHEIAIDYEYEMEKTWTKPDSIYQEYDLGLFIKDESTYLAYYMFGEDVEDHAIWMVNKHLGKNSQHPESSEKVFKILFNKIDNIGINIQILNLEPILDTAIEQFVDRLATRLRILGRVEILPKAQTDSHENMNVKPVSQEFSGIHETSNDDPEMIAERRYKYEYEDKPWEMMKVGEKKKLMVMYWWQGLEAYEISKKTGINMSSRSVTKRISELRQTYSEDIVPYEEERKIRGFKVPG